MVKTRSAIPVDNIRVGTVKPVGWVGLRSASQLLTQPQVTSTTFAHTDGFFPQRKRCESDTNGEGEGFDQGHLLVLGPL